MEKYSQYRDRGSSVAPFYPISPSTSILWLPVNVFLFVVRLPLLVGLFIAYFGVLQWLPLGSLVTKASLWSILGTSAVWWIDLQIDGVKRGSLSKEHTARLPQPSDIIASTFTSPLDALYLAAVFNPVFVESYPYTSKVRCVSLLSAIFNAFMVPKEHPYESAGLIDLREVVEKYPRRVVTVFPECTTTNGKGVLPLSPSILGASPRANIFPVSIRYTPTDVVTPVPRTYFSFLWRFLSNPTHCIRVRIAQKVINTFTPPSDPNDINAQNMESMATYTSSAGLDHSAVSRRIKLDLSIDERKVLNTVAESLERIGRSPRVGLTVKNKLEFYADWRDDRKRRS